MAKFSSLLLLLAVSNVVVGHLAESPQRRRATVSDRDSMAPSAAPSLSSAPSTSSAPTIEFVAKADKGSKASTKSSKTMKSSKFTKKIKGLAAYAEEAKDEKESKGSKSGENSKGSKSASDKTSKSDKKEKSAKADPPAPADPISSKSSTYAITYSPTKEIPTPKDLEQLAEMTEEYLEEFMMDFFDKTALTDLDSFLTVMVKDIFIKGQPVIAEYQSNGLFDADSIFIPVARELDNLIEDAIAQDDYLELLNDLPKSNPFRGTKTIGFTVSDSDSAGETTGSSGDSSSFVKAGMAAAAAGVVVLAAGLAMLKRRRPSFDDEDIQSLSPKSRAEDSTCAGESFDASTRFSHWRKSKPFSDAGEFKDEPL